MADNVSVVTLSIDGRPVGARADQSVLEVARENGIEIPTLCHLEGLSTVGACRLCLVEIEGQTRPVASCVTYAVEGMKVTSNSEKLQSYRRAIVQMLFSERNHTCAVCVSNGHCELQTMAQRLDITRIDLPYLNPKLEVDASHARFVADHNRCILCSRCVRVCDEIEGAHTWDVMGRGVTSRVITDMHTPWGESESCTECGKCVNVCPTGALVQKGMSVAEMAKQQQFLPYLTIMRRQR